MDHDPGDLQWRRSPLCDSGQCVELAASGDQVLLRSSADKEHVLRFSREEWEIFARSIPSIEGGA